MKNAQIEGLEFLLGNLDTNRNVYWSARDHKHATLEQHPFGFETGLSGVLMNEIYLVDYPGHTDESVNGMTLMLQHTLANRDLNSQFRLRITRVQQNRNPNQPEHDLYFEFITRLGTFLCGGCNDYSGHGGQGGKKLEAIFNFIASVYGQDVEEVVIRDKHAETIADQLDDAYNQHIRNRRAA